jgi:hypothetical protein
MERPRLETRAEAQVSSEPRFTTLKRGASTKCGACVIGFPDDATPRLRDLSSRILRGRSLP